MKSSYCPCAIQAETTGRFLFIRETEEQPWRWPGAKENFAEMSEQVTRILGYEPDVFNSFLLTPDFQTVCQVWAQSETITNPDNLQLLWAPLGGFPDNIDEESTQLLDDPLVFAHCTAG